MDIEQLVLQSDIYTTYLSSGLETPYERNKTNYRVDVEAQLRERAACASENSDQTIHASDFVEKLSRPECQFLRACSTTHTRDDSQQRGGRW